jgi:hypothetical protein
MKTKYEQAKEFLTEENGWTDVSLRKTENIIMVVASLMQSFAEQQVKNLNIPDVIKSVCDCKDDECCCKCEYDKTGTRNLIDRND